jgi:2,3-bisphosphoglycerate-dependent phosphoglycerate mutase
MRKNLVAIFLLLSSTAFSQEELVTTFILVRHAEKDLTQSTNDPDLSAEGKTRADRLVEMLKKTEVQAIYSTPYKRTQQTVAPLASSKSLEVVSYQGNKLEEVDTILKQHAGKTIVMVGHSNTIPQVVNYLVGEEKYRVMEDGDYGNIIVVSVVTKGKNAKVVWLKY